ncbi:MAG: type II secretion system F family protein [Hyphomicrobiales bacterium]
MPLNVIIIAALIAVGVMLIAVAIFLPKLNTEKRTNNRLQNISKNSKDPTARNRGVESAKRRKTVQASLSEIDEKAKSKAKKKASLALRLNQAGLSISKPTFFILSAVAAVIFALGAFVSQLPPLFIFGAAFVGGVGFPRFVINFLKNRRVKAFTNDLPEAIDIMVRGIKAGLPLLDGMRLVSSEAREPLASEFRGVVEAQQLGLPLGQAIQRINENIPTPETSFLATVITIQQSSGGSLSEALSNLGKILRERKKMRMKVKAISSEAKASAGIIGSLPIVVAGVVAVVSPDYIGRLFETSTGHIVLACAAGMMLTGIAVMRKMINFQI